MAFAESLAWLIPLARTFPNPELATTPSLAFPLAVPLSEPGPEGRSKDPFAATLTAFLWPVLAGAPFASPKPPACTSEGERKVVGVAELPLENRLVLTAGLGIKGRELIGSGSNSLEAILTTGAGKSVVRSAVFGCGRGSRKASAGATACAAFGGFDGLRRICGW